MVACCKECGTRPSTTRLRTMDRLKALPLKRYVIKVRYHQGFLVDTTYGCVPNYLFLLFFSLPVPNFSLSFSNTYTIFFLPLLLTRYLSAPYKSWSHTTLNLSLHFWLFLFVVHMSRRLDHDDLHLMRHLDITNKWAGHSLACLLIKHKNRARRAHSSLWSNANYNSSFNW